MARKISFFAFRSAYGLRQKWLSAPIALVAVEILFLMSLSSVRSKEMYEPRYLKWAVKSKNEVSSMWALLVFGDCQYRSSRCCWVMV